MRRGRRIRVGIVALLGVVSAGAAGAHGRSVSYSSWDLRGDRAKVEVRIERVELTRLGLDPTASREDARRAGARVRAALGLRADSDPCQPSTPAVVTSTASGWVSVRWELRCATAPWQARSLEVRSTLLLEAAPTHLHFARVRLSGGLEGTEGRVFERVLFQAEPAWEISRAAGNPRSSDGVATSLARSLPAQLARYLVLGIEHILTGWDHLAFVLALLLLAHSLREVATLVTGFTVAHSLTLALAVLGWVQPAGHQVEALIGFSVALVAAENGWILAGRGRAIPWLCAALPLALVGWGSLPASTLLGLALFSYCHFGLLERATRPARVRALVAFAFGLVHGFGFAGILINLDLPAVRLAPALFGFNVGVELGQLAVVALAWPLLAQSASLREGRPRRSLEEAGSAAICGLGVFWFLVRSLG